MEDLYLQIILCYNLPTRHKCSFMFSLLHSKHAFSLNGSMKRIVWLRCSLNVGIYQSQIIVMNSIWNQLEYFLALETVIVTSVTICHNTSSLWIVVTCHKLSGSLSWRVGHVLSKSNAKITRGELMGASFIKSMRVLHIDIPICLF